MIKRNIKKMVISLICILGASIVAILVHALMPSPGGTINIDAFNSLLVQKFGFPVVASSYFIFLYLHILIVLLCFGLKSNMGNKKIGLRFGAAFALIYFMGMQEVVIESSPFSSWGFGFVSYQFFMGLGDAIPAFILCIVITALIFSKKKNEISLKPQPNKGKLLSIGVIALTFFGERTIGYIVGYVDSDIEKFPIPVLIWTAIFGIIYGIAFILLYPIYSEHKGSLMSSINILVFTLGINWMIFNSFIGMIFAGTLMKMLLRSGVDAAAIFIVMILFKKLTSKFHLFEIKRG